MTFDGFAEHTPIHQQVEKHTHQRERSLITDRVQGEFNDTIFRSIGAFGVPDVPD